MYALNKEVHMSTPTTRGLSGTGYRQISMPRLTPEQQQLFSQVMGASGPGILGGIGNLSQMAGGGSPEFWEQLEAPAHRQFGQAIGGIGSRFSQLAPGAMSAQRSSGFQNALTGAAGDFASQLQSQRMGMQQSAIQQLLGLYGNLIGTQQFDTRLLPKKKPFWQELLGSLAPGLGQFGGSFGGLSGLRGLGIF